MYVSIGILSYFVGLLVFLCLFLCNVHSVKLNCYCHWSTPLPDYLIMHVFGRNSYTFQGERKQGLKVTIMEHFIIITKQYPLLYVVLHG